MNEENQYIPADVTEGDRTLATHCETFLCTECEMSRADRMARITQSIADYREHHAAKAREPVSKMLRDHLSLKFDTSGECEKRLLANMRNQIASPVTSWWQRPILRWAMRKLISPTFAAHHQSSRDYAVHPDHG